MNMDTIPSSVEAKLGAVYHSEETAFHVWAPTAPQVTLVLYEDAGVYNEEGKVTDHEGGMEYEMVRTPDGVWSVKVAGDLHGTYYMYRIAWEQGRYTYAVDPYARAVSANGCRGAIVDLARTNPPGWENDIKPPLLQPTDAVVYELHVRDFSVDEHSGMKYKGKYKAFTETGLRDAYGNAIGIDHLVELGITHVHLLPVFDFRTVNELADPDDRTGDIYNWGYDPQNYNVPEGSYATDPADPAVRIRELKEMVQALHKQGIRVVMDVVYNHTYTVDDGPFEPIVPGYYYRQDASGRLSNGSGVGNELATERPMVRKFIKDSLRYWAEEYHIDGFRFDLMALIDTTTMADIAEELRREVDETIMLYGEPWTGGDSPLTEQTVKGTQRGKGFAVFNDHFRHAIKGDNDGAGKGFATGADWHEGAVIEGMMGSIHDFAHEASESVNYVTVHDNLNLWDKILVSQGLAEEAGLLHMAEGELPGGGDVQGAVTAAAPYSCVDPANPLASMAVRRAVLANGIVLLSQGIPLLHAGDELLRTKYGDHNSYRSGDAINAIRWENKQRFRAVFDYYKGLITLRKQYPAFRMSARDRIEQHVEVLRSSDQLIVLRLTEPKLPIELNPPGDHSGGAQMVVIINGNASDMKVELPPSLSMWGILADDRCAGAEPFAVVNGADVIVPGLSIMVLREEVTQPKTRLTRIELEYERDDQAYDGWNVWVWGTGVRDGRIDFTRLHNGKAVAVIHAAEGVSRVGCIVRYKEWEDREGEHDRYMEIPPGVQHVKWRIRSGEAGWKPEVPRPDMAS